MSYSECGEDLIIETIFSRLGKRQLTYLDVGANDPTQSNNTYLFYKRGNHGVCVEPDPIVFRSLRSRRKRDLCLNIGIGTAQNGTADFYVMTNSALSTFSKDLADTCELSGDRKIKIEKILRIPLLSLNHLVESNFNPCPDLISLDIEGLDLDVLETFDFMKFHPDVFCVEAPRNNSEVVKFMNHHHYFLYACTWVNSIFVREDLSPRL